MNIQNEPIQKFQDPTSQQLFLRCLCLCYLLAFISIWLQIQGLIGADGLLPVHSLIAAVEEQLGAKSYRLLPTLCWIDSSDISLHLQCCLGVCCSILACIGYAPVLCFFTMWLLYLSITIAAQHFLGFQWDNLLLEMGFLAVFYAACNPGSEHHVWYSPSKNRTLSVSGVVV